MRVVVQRVTEARVTVDDVVRGEIGLGLLVLLGIEEQDQADDALYLARKTLGLRIFSDHEGKMNLNVSQAGGNVLIVSQFTLYGDCRKGMRPSFDRAAKPETAKVLYERFVEEVRKTCHQVATGVFQSHMKIALVNDGPVTLICNSDKLSE